jgi:hypothetical protein
MQGGGAVYLDMTGLSLGWPIPWYPACKGTALDTYAIDAAGIFFKLKVLNCFDCSLKRLNLLITLYFMHTSKRL